MYPEHKGKGKSSWEAVKRAVGYLNKKRKDVILLPELEGTTKDEVSADALILFNGKPSTADFKCPISYNWNSLQNAFEHGFKQAETIILYADGVKMDTGLLNETINYLLRNKKNIGNLLIINEYGKILEVGRSEILRGKFGKKIKGFL